jgi:eukaryotic-like serine/threonine-protein kinase
VKWLSRWLGRTEGPTASEPARPTGNPEPEEPNALARLLRVGDRDGATVDEALAALRRLRSTPDEAAALEALTHQAHAKPLPERLAVAAASALVDRGEPALAEKLLRDASSLPALMLTADLRAGRGDLTFAVAVAERVLSRDLDYPGARERHLRWRALLGLDPSASKPDPATATVATNRSEAPFLLLREVARGGSGTVYEAEDRELGRRVALKVYHRPDRDRAQLVHEGRVAAALAGPGIVRVFDIDPDQGWLALEWAPLGALRERIRAFARELLPLEHWVLPLAEGLARVHTAGWVHHDVKPANVLFRSQYGPVLGDFGSARRAGEPSPPGSLGYVSPERLAGRPSDPRDDVYGFGRVLEDALEAIGDTEIVSRYRPLVAACVGGDEGRPAEGRALVTRLRVEPGLP